MTMTQRDKLIQKIKAHQLVTFNEVHQLLLFLGFQCRIRGSHHNYAKEGIHLTLPAHGKELKRVYIIQLAEALKKDGY
jgi:predicted RNA binding protein YcfA (HicA-like mRNA interferase family)